MNSRLISEEFLSGSFDPESYISFFRELVKNGKTTGEHQTYFMTTLTASNLEVYENVYRLISPTTLNSLSSKIKKKSLWVLITEPWCLDAAWTTPLIIKLAETSEYIDLRIVLRDENDELMQQYLTNGKRSIPKLIAVHPETFQYQFSWGDKPENLNVHLNSLFENKQHVHITEKANAKSEWYKGDALASTIQELERLIQLNLS